MQLAETIKVPLSRQQSAAVARIDVEDFSGTMRKVAEELEKMGERTTPEFLAAGVLALKQYYLLPIIDPRNAHAVSDTIDPFWHAHILHTRQYAAFCDDVLGSFMHHEPLDHGRARDVAGVRFLYDYTREVMEKAFNYLDDRFYPVSLVDERLVCTHGQSYRGVDPCEEAFIFPMNPEAQENVLFGAR